MKTTEKKVKTAKEKKHMSKAQKKAAIGVGLSVVAPFTGIGQALIVDAIRDTIEEQKITEKAIREDDEIGKACDELIAKRKAGISDEVEETEEEKKAE